MNPAIHHCPACGHRTFGRDLRDAEGDVAALLSVRDGSAVCRWCEGRAERELDAADEELALDEDPDFVTVCDARRDGWIAAMESEQPEERRVVCACCGRSVPWYAVDTDGRCDACPAARRAA